MASSISEYLCYTWSRYKVLISRDIVQSQREIWILIKFYCKKNLLQKYVQIYLQTLSDFPRIYKFVGGIGKGEQVMWHTSSCLECKGKLCTLLTTMAEWVFIHNTLSSHQNQLLVPVTLVICLIQNPLTSQRVLKETWGNIAPQIHSRRCTREFLKIEECEERERGFWE